MMKTIIDYPNSSSNISNNGTSGGGGSFVHDTDGNLTSDGLSGLDTVYNDQNLINRISSGGTLLNDANP